MDECELDLLQKDLEADCTDVFKLIDRELEKKATTIPVENYERLKKIGQGTFGEVFKVRQKGTKDLFALKRLKMEQETEGFPVTALREIILLKKLVHENIVCLREVCHKRAAPSSNYRYEFYLLFDLCEHDLAGLLSNNIYFDLPSKKAIMKQLLTGLYYLHINRVMHRDLKTSNILIDGKGALKIADFGLARHTVASIHPQHRIRYTARVVTLWYRPPELLLGDRFYSYPVDLWGAGCIMAELWTRCPIMQGDSEISQLNLIIKMGGSIVPKVWPSVTRLEMFHKVRLLQNAKRQLREKLTPQIKDPLAVDLIDKLLMLDPSQRLDADQALSHDFFHEDPLPGDLSFLSKTASCYLEHSNQAKHARNHGPVNNFRAIQNNHNGVHVSNGNLAHQRVPGSSAMQQYRYRPQPDPDFSTINDRIY